MGLKSYNKEVGGLGGRNANGEPTLMLWWPQCEVIISCNLPFTF